MKYKGSENNIYSSDNLDPEFVQYLYGLPAQMLDDLFMAWAMLKNAPTVPIINIDAIYDKPAKPIDSQEIKDFYRYLKQNKIDLTKLNNK